MDVDDGESEEDVEEEEQEQDEEEEDVDVVEHENGPVVQDDGAKFTIKLGLHGGSGEAFRVPDLKQAMRENTTLTHLVVDFDYFFRMSNDQGFVQFLLRYISSSRNRNLDALTLQIWTNRTDPVCRQFVMAAAESETIRKLYLKQAIVPVQALEGFFRANRNVKLLVLDNVNIVHPEVHNDLDMQENNNNHRLEDDPTTVALDRLEFRNVTFKERAAAVAFADLASRFPRSAALELGCVKCPRPRGGAEPILPRMISNLVKSTCATSLELLGVCGLETSQTALMDGNDNLEDLSVVIGMFDTRADHVKKVDYLGNSIPKMAKLKNLHVTFATQRPILPEAKRRLFRAVDACATLTQIQVTGVHNASFTEREMQLLREGRTGRNRDLQRFMANPSPDHCPAKGLLKLVPQLENSATGRFQLVRNLPVTYFQGDRSGSAQKRKRDEDTRTTAGGVSKQKT